MTSRGNGGRTRVPLARSYPRVVKLKHKGLTNREVAEELGKSERAVEWILKNGRAQALAGRDPTTVTISDPLSVHLLTPEAKACLEPTVEGFERFFNRYSGFKLAPHSKRFVATALSEDSDKVLLNVPVGHAKSKVFAVWMTLWHICRDRNAQILLISKTRSLALKSGREVCGHMESNLELIRDFGRFRPDDVSARWSPSMGEFMVAGRDRLTQTGDLTLLCAGVGQFVYGIRTTLIIGDDLVDEDNSASTTEREKLEEWWHTIIESRLTPGARTIVIGTRFHTEDLYGHLSELEDPFRAEADGTPAKMWCHINFPAVLDWDAHTVLWPEMFSFEELMKRRASDERAFDRAYQQLPIAAGDRIVSPDAIELCSDHERRWGPKPFRGNRVVSLDPSPTRFAGVVVADVWGDRTNWTIEVMEAQRRRMKVSEMLEEIERLYRAYEFRFLIIEINAAQRFFLEDEGFLKLQRSYGFKVIPHTTNRNKGDSKYGTQSLGDDFSAGRIRLPAEDAESRDAVKPLVAGALAATAAEKDSDDTFMALWFIKWNLRKLLRDPVLRGVARSLTHLPPRLTGRRLPGFEKVS